MYFDGNFFLDAYLLQDHKSFSLVISITNQNGFKSGGNDSQTFTVQAPKYHRVMIVIQQLHLWPEIDKDSQSYLQVKSINPKISCGKYNSLLKLNVQIFSVFTCLTFSCEIVCRLGWNC